MPNGHPGLSYPLGRGMVEFRPDGRIAGVRPRPGADSYLAGGGWPRIQLVGVEVQWPAPTVAADVDEVEFGYAARGLGVVVRHAFAVGWSVRVTLVNHTAEPLTLAAELVWAAASAYPAWALGAGSTAAYAILGPGGRGPLLGGELGLGSCPGMTEDAIRLGPVELGPQGRRVVQWRWDWYAGPRAFNRNRFADVPRDLVLPENETARIAADDDAAVVAPGLDPVRRGPYLEFSSMGGHRVGIEVRSHRGVTAYDLEWVEPLDDVLAGLGDQVLAGPRNRVGVLRLADVDAALVLQHLLVRGRVDDREAADDALGLFVSRLDGPVVDGRGPSLLCGEFARTGEEDLLDRATDALLELTAPVPGLGLAAAQVAVARLGLGRPLDPVLDHLATLTAGDDGLDQAAVGLELALTARPRPATEAPGADRSLADRVRRIGTALGAGLRGRPVRPLPVDQQAYLSVVLALLPEALGAPVRPDWGVRPHDVARIGTAQVLARLAGQPPRPAHGWLVLGARLA